MVASEAQVDLAVKKHAIIMKYWAFSGWSALKISHEFSRDEELKKMFPEGVSVSSVTKHIKKIRIELESMVDEDALEKYTSEFIRKQYQYDRQIEAIEEMQNTIDVDDSKGKELWLKFESQKSFILDKQIKMMSDIELVLMVKQLNAKRRREIKTLNVSDTEKRLENRIALDVSNDSIDTGVANANR